MNRLYMLQSFLKNNNNSNGFRLNQLRLKRTYNAMLEQSHSGSSNVNLAIKKMKQCEGKAPEPMIKSHKPRIPEKIMKEIERYNEQRYSYSHSLILNNCPCEN